jgi:hypothetical protein
MSISVDRMSCLPFRFLFLIAKPLVEMLYSLGCAPPMASVLLLALLVHEMHHPQPPFINICLFESERLLYSKVSSVQAQENATVVRVFFAGHGLI